MTERIWDQTSIDRLVHIFVFAYNSSLHDQIGLLRAVENIVSFSSIEKESSLATVSNRLISKYTESFRAVTG